MSSPPFLTSVRRVPPSQPRRHSCFPQPSPPTSPPPEPSRSTPTNDDIEAVIKLATSSLPSIDRPLRDTRTQLFVGNLPYRVRWQDLKDLFRRAGTVLRTDVSLGPDNRSRGYGTVLLATAEDAGRAIDMFNGYCWQTRVLEVRPDRLGATLDADLNVNPSFPNSSAPFVQQGINIPSLCALNNLDEFPMALPGNGELLSGGTGMRTLFLPFHIQWQDLKDLFRVGGAVTRADVALGPDGRSRGFGTVTFVTEDGAERARRMFDG
ncbi:RNA-binding domain-containing protein [Boletus coccyginus]|nr:RNA-binding domain-containing protein [Boletus coccyginus]